MEVPGKRSDIMEEGAAEELETLCEVCEVDHVTTKANGICRECEQFMCDTCFTTHIKVKSCRQHVLVDTDQPVTQARRSSDNVENCKRHINEKIKYYCRKHEVVGCGDCMIPEHVPCRPENIKDLSKGFKQNENFKSLMIKLETIMSANKENDKKIHESQTENRNMLDKALKEIKKFRTEMNNYLDRAEESIIKQAKEIERDNDKLLTKLEQECTLLSSKITEMEKMLDTELYQDAALFIQTVDCKPRINDIEKELTRIQTENDIRTIEFMPNKQLQGIITSTERLGSLGEIESQSPTKPNITGLTKEVSREESACGQKQTEPVDGKKEKSLDYLHEIVSQGSSELRIDVTAADGSSEYELFRNFNISAGPNYTLHISRGTGMLGDQSNGLWINDNMHFSTFDHDMDTYSGNCAEKYHGALWVVACMLSNLNGIYFTPGTENTSSMSYYGFKNSYESLKSSRMMFRRV